jgi:hypothetical protein
MGYKKTFLFLLILLVLGGYYYFFELKSKEAKEKVEKIPELKKVFTFSQEKVIDIRISRGSGEEIHYQKTNHDWQIVKPLEVQGDASALDDFLEALKNLSEIESITEQPSGMREFGLDKPSLTLEFTTEGDIPPKTLFLGNDHPTHTMVYARTSDSPRVFVVGSLIRWEVDKEFDNLKNRRGPFFKGGK